MCKWNFEASADVSRWDRSFFTSVGFAESDLPESSIGAEVLAPGLPMPGGGVGTEAAKAMGLNEGTPIGIGMIDAHAGGLGCLGAAVLGEEGAGGATAATLEGRLGLIAGTSTCHMASSATPCFVPGVWGPYYSAMFPQLYLNEGGQSAAGAFLDFVIRSHPAGAQLAARVRIGLYTILFCL